MTDSPIVRVEEGQLQGRLDSSPTGKAFYSFRGIPYAKPPIGSLRFRGPQPPEPWDDIRDATVEGNSAAQFDPYFHKQYVGDENCLFLNIYTPNLDGEFLPVMVFVHGGGFSFGSGSSYLYGGDYLVEKDVVVVTINYRCGPLGFLTLNTPEAPGNAGLKDMAQAIRWIKQNIHNFGGNSGNLTVFGESAGGASVGMLLASPMTKDLINKAVIQSGTALTSWAFQTTPVDNARALAKELGCESTDTDEILEFLATTPVRDLVEATERVYSMEARFKAGKVFFGPVVEKEFAGVEAFLTEPFLDILTSGRIADVPTMIGSTTHEFVFDKETDDLQAYIPEALHIERNSDESLAIAEEIKNLYFKGNPTSVESLNGKFQLMSDVMINIDTHRYIQYLRNVTNKPIYYYKFDYVGELNISHNLLRSFDLKHAGHMDELGYLFRNEMQKDVEATPQDVKMRERVLRLWTNFAKSGNPTPDENHYLTVTWLPVSRDNLYYLNLGNELSIGTNPDKEKMEFWISLYDKYYKSWNQPKSTEEISPVAEKIDFVVDTTPIIVEETVVTTVTTTVESNGEERVETQVSIEVTDTTGEQIQYEETHVEVTDNGQIEAVVNDNFVEVQENLVDVQQNLVDVKQNSVDEQQNSVDEQQDLVNVQENLVGIKQNSVDEQQSLVEVQDNSVDVQDNIVDVQQNVAEVQDNLVDLQQNVAEVQDNSVDVQQNLVDVQNNVETAVVQDNLVQETTHEEKVQIKVAENEVNVVEQSYENREIPEKIDILKIQEKFESAHNGGEELKFNGNFERKPRPSNEIKMVQSNNINPKDVIRANDPPEDDLPKNIGVNKFVNFFESLGGKK